MADPDIVTRLRESDGGFFMRQMFTESADEIERLRAERDEARRKFCEMMSNNSRLEFTTPQWFAEEEDWDCYKEDGK